jgi:hypothetical protein
MPVDASVTIQGLQEPVVAASDVSPSLEGPTVTSSTVSLPPKGARLQEPTAASSAITSYHRSSSRKGASLGADHYFIGYRYSSSRIGIFYHQIVYIFPCAALLTCLLSGPEPISTSCSPSDQALSHLPFFRARVEQAHHRIETRRSQVPLKANIAERCQSLNEKKAALDAKADTFLYSQRLHLLEKELEDLKARVRATEQRIQEEKDLIVSSKREAQALTAQLKVDLAELSALSRQVVSGVDKDDEAVIVEANHVRLEAIAAIDEFLQ